MSKPTLFIDGEAGTTGLEIRKRLEGRTDIQLVSIAADKRKDLGERKRILNGCDLAILCLPDEAAREAVALIDNPTTRILDASTAFRTDPNWVYGFPEMTAGQSDLIRAAKRVSNPGCYPTGAIALIRPLIEADLLPSDLGITVTAVSGYSGGGKELIALCEKPDGGEKAAAFCLYGLDQNHKHLPEMRMHGRLARDPIFLPSYSGAFYRGMLITIALRLDEINRHKDRKMSATDVHQALTKHYQSKNHVLVEPLQRELEKGYVLTPLAQNETNNVQLRVFHNSEKGTLILTACLDNLGKGASGAAVQNAELMLGLSS